MMIATCFWIAVIEIFFVVRFDLVTIGMFDFWLGSWERSHVSNQGQQRPVAAPGDARNTTQDVAIQVGPPSLGPTKLVNDACKLQAELAKKDMELIGLSPLAVIMMIVVIGEFESIPSGNSEHVRKTLLIPCCSTVCGSIAASGQQLVITHRNLEDRVSVLNKCGYQLKKTEKELKEERERSAKLEKALKMLDNQWVGSAE